MAKVSQPKEAITRGMKSRQTRDRNQEIDRCFHGRRDYDFTTTLAARAKAKVRGR